MSINARIDSNIFPNLSILREENTLAHKNGVYKLPGRGIRESFAVSKFREKAILIFYLVFAHSTASIKMN